MQFSHAILDSRFNRRSSAQAAPRGTDVILDRPGRPDFLTPVAPGRAGSPHASIVSMLWRALTGVETDSIANFEIRNVRTGERADSLGSFADGTLADRTARELGRDWRVFRKRLT